jgi:hypothetical protein
VAVVVATTAAAAATVAGELATGTAADTCRFGASRDGRAPIVAALVAGDDDAAAAAWFAATGAVSTTTAAGAVVVGGLVTALPRGDFGVSAGGLVGGTELLITGTGAFDDDASAGGGLLAFPRGDTGESAGLLAEMRGDLRSGPSGFGRMMPTAGDLDRSMIDLAVAADSLGTRGDTAAAAVDGSAGVVAGGAVLTPLPADLVGGADCGTGGAADEGGALSGAGATAATGSGGAGGATSRGGRRILVARVIVRRQWRRHIVRTFDNDNLLRRRIRRRRRRQLNKHFGQLHRRRRDRCISRNRNTGTRLILAAARRAFLAAATARLGTRRLDIGRTSGNKCTNPVSHLTGIVGHDGPGFRPLSGATALRLCRRRIVRHVYIYQFSLAFHVISLYEKW